MTGSFISAPLWIRSLPIISAIVYQAILLQRWPVTLILVSLNLLILHLVNRRKSRSLLIAVCLFSSFTALLIPGGESPVIGLLPAVFATLFLNIIISSGVVAASLGSVRTSFLLGWCVIGVSISPSQNLDALYPLLCFVISILFYASMESGLFQADRKVHLTYGVFILLVGLVTAEFGNFTKAARLIIQNAIANYYDNGSGTSITGIGRELFVGTRGVLSLSESPVLDLSVSVSRLRVNVFDGFDGAKWYSSKYLQRQTQDVYQSDVDPDELRQLEVMWLEQPDEVIPTPAGTIHVFGENVKLGRANTYRIKNPPRQIRLIFDQSELLRREKVELDSMLTVPVDLQPRFKRFGDELLHGGGDAASKARIIEAYFQDNYSYSLNTSFSGDQHPLIEMLESSSKAYCVYFASAMALTLRSQGIPTRIVSGFLPVEMNRITGRVTVRKRDAHAWVEVWSAEQQRFLTFDPTPIEARREALGIRKSRSLVMDFSAAAWDFFRRTWIASRGEPIRFFRDLLLSMIYEISISVVLLMVLWRVLVQRKIRSSHLQRTDFVDADLIKAYEAFSRGLRKKGVRLRSSQPDAVAVKLLRKNGLEQSAYFAERFLVAYRQRRYGGTSDSESLINLAKEIGVD